MKDIFQELVKIGTINNSPFFDKKFLLKMMIPGVTIISLAACSFWPFSKALLPHDLEKSIQLEASEYFTTAYLENYRLDTIIELTIRDVRHPDFDPEAASGWLDKEMWCVTTTARGKRDGVSHEVSMDWFAFREEGNEWLLIPRYLVSYPWIWDSACDQADRLDQ